MACYVDAAAFSPSSYSFSLDDSVLSFSSLRAETASVKSEDSNWSPHQSADLYKINSWGVPYFSVNSSGNVSVHPHGANSHDEIDLFEIVKYVSEELEMQPPLIIRFPEVLKHRIEALQAAFDYAVSHERYSGHYQGVYPVKCNQDRFVVEEIVRFGSRFHFGLEAGSKPELLLAMSLLCCEGSSREAFLICNGFKDLEYVSLAFLCKRLSLNVFIVIEQEEEVDLIIDMSRRISVKPSIGLRAKLRTKHEGHFGSTSGEKGKFGLTTVQILRVFKKLEFAGMLNCLELLHFHIGSQIPTIELLEDGVCEAAQIYCELALLGAPMCVIDIGGGLGVDYDGSKCGSSDASIAYEVEDYAMAVVRTVKLVCDKKKVRHPVICSESGRALVSHHSVLVFEAIAASNSSAELVAPHWLRLLLAGDEYKSLAATAVSGNLDATLHHIEELKGDLVQQFKEGSIGIEQVAMADELCELVLKAIGAFDPILSYHVNLSVFTSIPDFWGFGQLFPILPIHRLSERPTVRATLYDLTCDSDGKIDKFIGGESSLPLHEILPGGYYLGMFLGGAYEEALGGIHNLFGSPGTVWVSSSDGPCGFCVTQAVPGPSCGDILRAMHHESDLMHEKLKRQLSSETALAMENVVWCRALSRAFHGTSYLDLSLPRSIHGSPYGNGEGDDDSIASEEDDCGRGCVPHDIFPH